LVIALGTPEYSSFANGRHGAALEGTGLNAGKGVFSGLALGRALDKDCRAIGGASVTELAPAIGGVNQPPEPVNQLAIADLAGIKGDLNALKMACGFRGDLLIGRIGLFATRVTRLDRYDAGYRLHVMLDTPEAAAGEECGFGYRGGKALASHHKAQTEGY